MLDAGSVVVGSGTVVEEPEGSVYVPLGSSIPVITVVVVVVVWVFWTPREELELDELPLGGIGMVREGGGKCSFYHGRCLVIARRIAI